MSCPDWPTAAAWRRDDGAAPAGWQGDLEHLAGCPSCRERVARLDPTLLLAAAAAPAPAIGDDEVGVLAATVRSMVAGQRLAARRRPDRRALLAAAALVALLAAPVGFSRLTDGAGRTAAPPERLVQLPDLAEEPPIEEVQPAGARVYQFGTEDLPVILIFDESLDL